MASPTKEKFPRMSEEVQTSHSKESPDSKNPQTDVGNGEEAKRQPGEDGSSHERDNDDAASERDKEFEEASAVVARHVKLLREYNKIKDVGQQLMGIVAENRGVTVGSLYATREFGVGPKD
nr:duf1337 domain-containing protein [Colletotrichum truncatum]KAF6782622.1 duf1337 domain-containing protein [Colletotrichum truncatum]